PDVRLWEDKCALVADDSGTVFHSRIAYLASKYLLKKKYRISHHKIMKDKLYNESIRTGVPHIVMEIGGRHQVKKVINDLKKYGFGHTEIWKDAMNKERCIVAKI
ncbi:12903_t:CDS:1, partial [Acaulospora morrowiae]